MNGDPAPLFGMPSTDAAPPASSSSESNRRLSPAEKLTVAFGLHETAWRIASAGLRLRHPELDEEAVQERVRALFLRAVS